MDLCESTLLFAFLALLYLLLSLAILLSIYRLQRASSNANSAAAGLSSFALSSPTSLNFSSSSLHQQLFLACALVECTLRFLYFLLYPLLSAGCHSLSLLPASPHPWLNALGHLPTCLLLLCLSILAYSLARIYHILLLAGGKRQRVRLYLLSTLLVLLNTTVVITEAGQWLASGVLGGWAAYVVAADCAVMGVLLFMYGRLLFRHVQAILELSVVSSPLSASLLTAASYRATTAPLPIHRQVAPLPMNGLGSMESGSSSASSSGGASLSPASYIPIWRAGGGDSVPEEDSVVVADKLVTLVSEEQLDDSVEYGGHDSFSYSDGNVSLPFSPTPFTPITAQPSSLITSSSPSLHTASSSSSHSLTPTTAPANPLRRLAVLSALVTLCLWLRSSVLLLVVVLLDDVWSVSSTVVYWCVGEVLPLVLMLRLMEGERGGSTSSGSSSAAGGSEVEEEVERSNVQQQQTPQRPMSGERQWTVL